MKTTRKLNKSNKNNKELLRFEKYITFHLEEIQIRKAQRAINLHYFNDEECNVYVEKDGFKGLVGKYDDHPNYKKALEASYNLNRSYTARCTVKLFNDGKLKIEI